MSVDRPAGALDRVVVRPTTGGDPSSPGTTAHPEPRAAESLSLLLPAGPVPLGFVRDSPVTYLIARERSARWPVEILRAGRARLNLAGVVMEGRPVLLTNPVEKLRVLELFRRKYGARTFERWYDHPARILRVDSTPHVALDPTGGYFGWLSAEFDNVADEYDHHITGNRINRLLRDRSLAVLRGRFAASRSLLEIGCGSGMETIRLLEDGHEMLCVDISQRMLDVVREKARSAGFSERLRTRRLAASGLGELTGEIGPGSFDGGYSTYGALNCEEDLRPIPPELHRLIRPGGRFVAGVYNRWCLFELLGYSMTGQFGRATGRTHRPVPVGSSRFCVDVFAHSAGEFRGLFAPWFGVERVEGVPVLLPPSDLVGYAEKFARHFDALARWDGRVGRAWPFRALGDHFLMTFARHDAIGTSPATSGRVGAR